MNVEVWKDERYVSILVTLPVMSFVQAYFAFSLLCIIVLLWVTRND